MDEKEAWNQDGCGLGLPGDLLGEMLHHVVWAQEKCRGFVGRKALVQQALTMITSQSTSSSENDWSGITLSVIGRSGTGKTALMAELARSVRATDTNRPVIIRFCGTSKGSADGLSLVQSLCHQIQLVVEMSPDQTRQAVPENYEAAVTLLHTLVNQHAMVLFIDSLDQLTDINQARSKISFLRGVKPHPDTRIVVSAIPDDKPSTSRDLDVESATKRYYYGCETCLAMNQVPRVVVSDFSEASAVQEAREILQALLAGRNRTLTSEQWDVVMAAVATADASEKSDTTMAAY